MPPETTWHFYTRPADAWEAMYTDCGAARTSIDIEQYIFSNDEIGTRFLDILRKKNKEGVAVRIICDAVGSSDLMDSGIATTLAAEGIKIKFFNPIQPWRIGNIASWFLRDHRKLLVVDGTIAHTGGVGLEDRMKYWRDTNVKIAGPIVGQIQADFNQMWNLIPRRTFSSLKPVFHNGEVFSFLTNSPRFHRRYLYHDLLHAIRRAKKYIYLTTPYFVPGVTIFTALTHAARRGVDVRILVPDSSDVRLADIGAGSYFLLALNAGIKIYHYSRITAILHAKTGIIDDGWASIGSANIDNLSLLLNFEGNIRSTDPAFIAELKGYFLNDISEAKLLSKDVWVRRPLSRKILEVITWPIHGIL